MGELRKYTKSQSESFKEVENVGDKGLRADGRII
jgi:hypothetical protein